MDLRGKLLRCAIRLRQRLLHQLQFCVCSIGVQLVGGGLGSLLGLYDGSLFIMIVPSLEQHRREAESHAGDEV
jgi:hypothetical protein